jgi:hypothetical protein
VATVPVFVGTLLLQEARVESTHEYCTPVLGFRIVVILGLNFWLTIDTVERMVQVNCTSTAGLRLIRFAKGARKRKSEQFLTV